MKVYIGVPTSEQARHAAFYDYLSLLEKPEGTCGASFHSNTAAYNRNLIIDDALAAKSSHVLFIDDDMAMPTDSLIRLLSHDKDIVSGLYVNRQYPHPPVIFNFINGTMSRIYLTPENAGLMEVSAAGFGFLLVKTKVFASLDKPYVRNGEIVKDRRNEDIDFCNRARAAGFKIYCDLDCPIGHIGTTTFWPAFSEGKWATTIDTGGDEVFVAAQNPTKFGEIRTPLTKS